MSSPHVNGIGVLLAWVNTQLCISYRGGIDGQEIVHSRSSCISSAVSESPVARGEGRGSFANSWVNY